MEDFFAGLFIVALTSIIVSGVLFAIAAIIKKKRDAENAAKPICSEMARLVDMPHSNLDYMSEMWVLFELNDGRRIRLLAKPKNSLVVGDVGVLTWQGSKILGFKRQINGEEEKGSG